MSNSMESFQQTSFLYDGSSTYLEALYKSYLIDPKSVSSEWRTYFEQLTETSQCKKALEKERKQSKVYELIDAYRLLGYLEADIDPLKLHEIVKAPEMELSFYQLSEEDLTIIFEVDALPGQKQQTLKQIVADLKHIYCGTVASEFMHISDSVERLWVQTHLEAMMSNLTPLPLETKRHILERLVATEGLEKYLGAKYPGAKRFSLEGTDTFIIILDTLIQEGGVQGMKESVICMAHRGRLNVLVNILGKTPSLMFEEFEGKHDVTLESGDVKYHQGFSSDVPTAGGNVHLNLVFNPSHLEIVTPVACGSVKARQIRLKDKDYKEVYSIAIHGDAAFAGQGVVMETLNMSQTRGFKIGGTLHIIMNNQIGFTTSDPRDARSTMYCSDIGKMMGIPIFHVNADDPEAVYKITKLALYYREKFHKDVIIDLVGYRRQGHNEADDPSATQPIMYQIIRKLPTACQDYIEQLISENVITEAEAKTLQENYRTSLDKREATSVQKKPNGLSQRLTSDWSLYTEKDWRTPVKTGVPLSLLKKWGEKLGTLPADFVLDGRVQKIIDERRKMTAGASPIDWGYAEILAYASLLEEGNLVRLSGQDSARGTFFHRHAVLYNQTDGSSYCPLSHLSEKQGLFFIVNTLLSEAAVLGFEYGFATTEPKSLVIWEAQYGDFANNAQGVIDQFISSGEHKWGRLCGLTLFLPHGYEGQGPEHSSARLERYLQLCAEHNMQVCEPTLPSQMFHLLRRQVLRPMRKPLIVLTPKSLLRNKLAVSSLEDLEKGTFMPVISEIDPIKPKVVRRVVLCSGKVYFDLLEKRRLEKKDDIAIVRIEQLYPFPEEELKKALKLYVSAKEVVWCQEEPQNQGGWYSIEHHFRDCLLKEQTLRYVGRKPSAAAAVGYIHLHQEQQAKLVEEALS